MGTRKFRATGGSSEDFDLDTGTYSIDYYYAAKDDFRAAPEGKFALPWPYDRSRPSPEAVNVAGSIEDACRAILQDHRISLYHMQVQGLSPRGMFRPQDTLVISTHDEDANNWKAAATMVQLRLDEASPDVKIRVEIRNEQKKYRDVSSIIIPHTPAHITCQEAEPIIYKDVKKNCAGLWTTISYHMRGPPEQTQHRQPTVIISMAPGSRSIWDLVEAKIRNGVAHLNIDVELVPGRAMLAISQEMLPTPRLVLRNLAPLPLNGSSIGARDITTQAGSVGVFVNFRGSGQEEVEKCFLTCCHVIIDNDGSAEHGVGFHGVGLYGRQAEVNSTVDYPARYDEVETRRVLQGEITSNNDGSGNGARTLSIINGHLKAGGIGKVIHASGLRRKNSTGRRMDWAIIRLHNQTSILVNKPPPANFSPAELFYGKLRYEVSTDEVVSHHGVVNDGSWVSKTGRTTGITAGEVNAMKIKIDWMNGMESDEMQINPVLGGQPFVSGGDSGGMVFNLDKEWVGMVLGKLSHEDAGIVTPVQELLDDIREKTSGTVSLV
ncbi:hypothetical protein GMDG_01317 [Pseudogymnoascus destructans 20631-21]|uniref:Peptidase S1 domain-containing protein n=1 Tax=Pseudogymnoascus destructans (strain ATCC MYA-4855 / 20631-21) TaxID=658429 RepID=L8FTH5_PSED2|nr:hypothetical protein GMDG_01317 [Pseudogymnoascus destructans 20631-21]